MNIRRETVGDDHPRVCACLHDSVNESRCLDFPSPLSFTPLAAMVGSSAQADDGLPKVPIDSQIELLAKEPLVRKPCSEVFDDRGRFCIGMGPGIGIRRRIGQGTSLHSHFTMQFHSVDTTYDVEPMAAFAHCSGATELLCKHRVSTQPRPFRSDQPNPLCF